MNKKKAFLLLQIKNSFKSVPSVLGGTLVFSFLAVVFVVFAIKIMDTDSANQPFNVALVVEDDNKYTKLAISYLFEEETIKSTCNFIEMTGDEAEKSLEEDSVGAVVIIPDGFFEGVIKGTNILARIILSKSGVTSQSQYFQEMVRAGASDLATAQAIFYAVSDLYTACGVTSVNEAGEYLDRKLMLYALGRNTYYKEMEQSVFGKLPIVWFYIAGAVVLLLLLSGIVCCDVLKREKDALVTAVKIHGISFIDIAVSKLFSVMAIYVPILWCIYIVLSVKRIIPFSVPAFAMVIVLVFAVFSINMFVLWMANDRMTGIMILFLGSICMLFVSGNIIPGVFLSKTVNIIGCFMPAKYIVNLCGQILTGEVTAINAVICVMIGVLFTTASVVCERTRKQRVGN